MIWDKVTETSGVDKNTKFLSSALRKVRFSTLQLIYILLLFLSSALRKVGFSTLKLIYILLLFFDSNRWFIHEFSGIG